jgi:2-polyprenyl-3-methyl-5-hydroxy-6-metoxy-1,4-benzoquinol methylase
MRRLNRWDKAKAIEYNLRDNGTAVAVFADTQPGRLWYVHEFIKGIIAENPGRLTIVELGCSAGDIAGVFSEEHDCYGYDVVPDAVRLSRERYPAFHVEQLAVEDVIPSPCDILVLCEILEHIEDPVSLVQQWLPLAKHVVIGHPLVGDGYDPEEGHLWAYYDGDFEDWFPMGGHALNGRIEFPMGYRMVLGRGDRI